MSEYKAQILTAILAIVVFAILNALYPTFFKDVWNQIASKVILVVDGL